MQKNKNSNKSGMNKMIVEYDIKWNCECARQKKTESVELKTIAWKIASIYEMRKNGYALQ